MPNDSKSPCRAFIGLGSNLSDPSKQVMAAIDALSRMPQTQLLHRSRLYVSAPWGLADQPEFVNAVAAVETTLSPRELMEALLAVERDFGRQRSNVRWGPRILDLDLLLYADWVIDEAGLRVPHPHLRERAFVLLPLAEIAADLHIPRLGSVSRLLAALDVSACRMLDPA